MMTDHSDQKLGFSTRAIHAGQEPDPATGAVIPPIYQSSTYVFSKVGEPKTFEYSRIGNPTRTAFEVCLSTLEGSRWALAFGSGMAAESAVALLLRPGDNVVCADDLYAGTHRLFTRVFGSLGITLTPADLSDPARAQAVLRPETKMLWLESPTNPLLKILDLRALSALARERGITVVVDNTFSTPYLQRPLDLGADIVVYSATKYLGGHSDLVGGAVTTSDPELHERLRLIQSTVGAVPGPFDCWLALRGLKTLAIRMERHSRNALELARFLESRPAVARVSYPGLSSHPGHELAGSQMRLFGGMVTFEMEGGEVAARRLAEGTRLLLLAESLGGVESLIEVPARMTHSGVAGTPLEIDPAVIRMSVGLEDPEDLIADLEQALSR